MTDYLRTWRQRNRERYLHLKRTSRRRRYHETHPDAPFHLAKWARSRWDPVRKVTVNAVR